MKSLDSSQSTSIFFNVDQFPDYSRLHEKRASARRLDSTAHHSRTLLPPQGCSSRIAPEYCIDPFKCTDIMSLDPADSMVDLGVHFLRLFPGYLRVRRLSCGPGRAIQPDMLFLKYRRAGKTDITGIYSAAGHLHPYSCVIVCVLYVLYVGRHFVEHCQRTLLQQTSGQLV